MADSSQVLLSNESGQYVLLSFSGLQNDQSKYNPPFMIFDSFDEWDRVHMLPDHEFWMDTKYLDAGDSTIPSPDIPG